MPIFGGILRLLIKFSVRRIAVADLMIFSLGTCATDSILNAVVLPVSVASVDSGVDATYAEGLCGDDRCCTVFMAVDSLVHP